MLPTSVSTLICWLMQNLASLLGEEEQMAAHSVATGSARAERAAEPSCHFGHVGRLTCERLLSGS